MKGWLTWENLQTNIQKSNLWKILEVTIHKLAKTSSMLLATLADMEKLLKSMEDRIIPKLSDQLSADRATID